MIEALSWIAVSLYALVLALLLPFAGHRLALLLLSRRRAPGGPAAADADAAPPRVTVQLPVFNEKHVIERLLDATCRLRHPRSRLQIQVLDDSTDETTALARRRARTWRRRGVDIEVLHRTDRIGYKAGALAAGLEAATGEYVLILDADFVPPPTLLEELLPSMSDPGVGMVQARWDHLNEHGSWLTRAQGLLLDGHFFLEQRGRFRGRRFFNFNGTAGLWRRQALIDAGGWQSDTLTEDLDVSYRAQMAGWRFMLRDDVGVPAELPATPGSLLVQQRRWAQGGVQTARKVLPRLFRASFGPAVKFEAFIHLCGHLAHPLTFALSLLIVPAALARQALGMDRLWWIDLALFTAATAPFIVFYWTAARRRGRERGSALKGVAGTLALGAGLSVLLSRAVLRGLGRFRDPFERTPKAGATRRSSYEAARQWFPGRGLAVGAGAFMIVAGVAAVVGGQWGSLPFVALFATGYLALGLGAGRGPGAALGAVVFLLATAVHSPHPFAPTLLAAQEARTFEAVRPLGPGTELTASVSLGDVNGDGALDVVVANGRHWAEQNRVYLNDGRGAFTLARRLGEEAAGSYSVPLADFDGDGDLDVAVGNDRTRNLVFLNDGEGRFAAGATFGAPSSTRSLTLADLNADGHTDILVVNRGRRNFIFHGDGSGGFDEGALFGAGDDSTIDVVAADLDGDGDLDLVLANRDGGANEIRWNDAGDFSRRSGYGTGSDETRGVAVGDVDGDGRLDIVTANIGEANAVYFGDGSGGFGRSLPFGGAGDQSYAVRLADVDLDGDPDIVVANVGGRNAVYFNRGGWVAVSDEAAGGGKVAPGDEATVRDEAAGSGEAARLEEFRFGCEDCDTYGVAVGDLDGDGFPEIVTANSGARNGIFANVPTGRD